MTYPTNRPELLRRFNTGEAFDFVFFWGHQPKIGQTVDQHCLSQWFAAPFEIDGILYPTAEHFMMAEKARLFRDATTLAAILHAKDPGSFQGTPGFFLSFCCKMSALSWQNAENAETA